MNNCNGISLNHLVCLTKSKNFKILNCEHLKIYLIGKKKWSTKFRNKFILINCTLVLYLNFLVQIVKLLKFLETLTFSLSSNFYSTNPVRKNRASIKNDGSRRLTRLRSDVASTNIYWTTNRVASLCKLIETNSPVHSWSVIVAERHPLTRSF